MRSIIRVFCFLTSVYFCFGIEKSNNPILDNMRFCSEKSGNYWVFNRESSTLTNPTVLKSFSDSVKFSSENLLQKIATLRRTLYKFESIDLTLGLEIKAIDEKVIKILQEYFISSSFEKMEEPQYGGVNICLESLNEKIPFFGEDLVTDHRAFLRDLKFAKPFEYTNNEEQRKVPNILIKSCILSFILDEISSFIDDLRERKYALSSQITSKYSFFAYSEDKSTIAEENPGFVIDCVLKSDMSKEEAKKCFDQELCSFYGYRNNFLSSLQRLTHHLLEEKTKEGEDDCYLAFYTTFLTDNPFLEALTQSIQNGQFDFFEQKQLDVEECIKAATLLSSWSSFYRACSEILSGIHSFVSRYKWLNTAMCFREIKKTCAVECKKKISKQEREKYIEDALKEIEGDTDEIAKKHQKGVPNKKGAPKTKKTEQKKPKCLSQQTQKKHCPSTTIASESLQREEDAPVQSDGEVAGNTPTEQTEIIQEIDLKSGSNTDESIEDLVIHLKSPPLPIDYDLPFVNGDQTFHIDVDDIANITVNSESLICPPTIENWMDLLQEIKNVDDLLSQFNLSHLTKNQTFFLYSEIMKAKKVKNSGLSDIQKYQKLFRRYAYTFRYFLDFLPIEFIKHIYGYNLNAQK